MQSTTQTYKHYYPFGLKHGSYYSTANIKLAKKEVNELVPQNLLDGELKIKPTTDRAYKYKYNGKEWQDELGLAWYDYGARNYEPSLGRWMNLDPLAEKYQGFSPYNYTLNNPINLVDPDGRSVNWHKNKEGNLVVDKGDSAYSLSKQTGIDPKTANKIITSQFGANRKVNGKEYSNIKEGDVLKMNYIKSNNGSNIVIVPDDSPLEEGAGKWQYEERYNTSNFIKLEWSEARDIVTPDAAELNYQKTFMPTNFTPVTAGVSITYTNGDGLGFTLNYGAGYGLSSTTGSSSNLNFNLFWKKNGKKAFTSDFSGLEETKSFTLPLLDSGYSGGTNFMKSSSLIGTGVNLSSGASSSVSTVYTNTVYTKDL